MITNIVKLDENSSFETFKYVVEKVDEHFNNCGHDPVRMKEYLSDKELFEVGANAVSQTIMNGFDIYVLKHKEKCVGFMYLLEPVVHKEITSIFVEEAYRKKGLASRMVSFALSKGCKCLSTFGCLNVGIFEKLGFKLTGKTTMLGKKEYRVMRYVEELK
jgi:GNAT superfamily N-acetyltransferase